MQDPLLFRKYVQASVEYLVNRTVQVSKDAHYPEELSSVLTTVKKKFEREVPRNISR